MLFWFGNTSNDISSNETFLYLKSSMSSRLSGVPVYKDNFRRAIGLYVARNRKVIIDNFGIHEDVYLAPKVNK